MRFGTVALIAAGVFQAFLVACAAPEGGGEKVSGGPDQPPARRPVRVVTDGRFDEWGAASVVIEDLEDAVAGAAVDFAEVRLIDDERWLHLALELRRPVNLQRLRGTLLMLLDGDGRVETGGDVYGMHGVDLMVELSRRDPAYAGSPGFEEGIGFGNSMRPVTADGLGRPQSLYPVDFLAAPTFSATRFELRLRRGLHFDGVPILLASETLRLKWVLEDETGTPDETEVGTYRWTAPLVAEPDFLVEPSSSKAEGVFRVVAWNVAGEGIRDHPGVYGRILAALDADVVLLDEVFGEVTRADLETFFTAQPLTRADSRDSPWMFALGNSGGRQKNVVASRQPLRPASELQRVDYPPGSLERLADEVDTLEFRQLAGAERERGVATAGAWVDLRGRETLLVPLDLQSGGYDGSAEDRLRELQASVLRDRINSLALAGTEGGRRGLPVIVGGDLNLVGSTRPLEILRHQAASDELPELSVAEAYRLNDRSQATWRDVQQGVFTPGRLDFLLYNGVVLALDRAFVFDSAELSAAHLDRLGVEQEDSAAASGHLPVVGDFRWIDR